uniref:Uncharacterized protein n=1 Tax=Sciurus vulgaris TaxID=55149 RepID=A0A8D2BFC6_SCIVU
YIPDFLFFILRQGLANLPRILLPQPLELLRLQLCACHCTHGTLLALGNVLAQMIEKTRKNEDSQNLDIGGPLRYAVSSQGKKTVS